MEKKTMAIIAVIAVVAVILVAGSTNGWFGKQHANENLSISGSTTVLPIAQNASEAFMANNSWASITVSGGGTGVGIQSVGTGTVQIGMASRQITSTEKALYPNLVETQIGLDGIVMIVHTSNSVSSLSMTQIRGIYNGTYTNWNQLGGSNLPIVVVGRDSTSGTRTFFSDTVMKKQNCTSSMLEKSSNGAVQETIKTTPGAIGYVGLGYVDSTVKGLPVEVNGLKITASASTILDNSYPIARGLYFYTQGQPTGIAKDYIDFVLSADGQNIVSDQGFVKLP